MPGIHAASLSINFTGGCNANCPYCIASSTWKTGCKNNFRILGRLDFACRYAAFHGVDTVLITGSGEPLIPQNVDNVGAALLAAKEVGIPVTEVQTNGQTLATTPNLASQLRAWGLNTIAISVSSPDPKESAEMVGLDFDYMELVRKLSERFMVRVSLNLSELTCRSLLDGGLGTYADLLREAGASQLTLRELGVPDNPLDTPLAQKRVKWVEEHALHPAHVRALNATVISGGKELRRLPYGPMVYDYHGLSVAVATCMTETTDPTQIRSLILQPDGGIYHTWNWRGSRLA